MAIKTAASSTLNAAQQNYVTNTVTSKDGTTISYRQLGRGPGLIMLHGAMESKSSIQMRLFMERVLKDIFQNKRNSLNILSEKAWRWQN